MSHDGHYDLVTYLSTRLAEGNKSEGVFAITSSTVRPMPLLVAHRKCVGIIGRSQLKGDPGGIIYLLQGRECRSIKEVESKEVVRLLRQNEELLSSLVTTQ